MTSKFTFNEIMLITDNEYFLETFYTILSSDSKLTQKQAYYILEDMHIDVANKPKYSSFESFINTRNKKLSKKHNKVVIEK